MQMTHRFRVRHTYDPITVTIDMENSAGIDDVILDLRDAADELDRLRMRFFPEAEPLADPPEQSRFLRR